ncbi:hypothetical protein MMPV_005281 [Pyropia vietnamensis]
MGLATAVATAAAAVTIVGITLASGGAAAASTSAAAKASVSGGNGRTARNGVTPWVWEHPLTGGVVSTSVTGCHVSRDGSLLVVGTATSAAGTVAATVTKLAAASGAVLDTATLPGVGGTSTSVVASVYDADEDLLLLTGLASGGVPPPAPGDVAIHQTTANGGGGADIYVAAWSTLPPATAEAASATDPAVHLVRRFTATLGGAGDDVPLGVAAISGGRYAVVGSARRAAGAGPPDGLLVGVLSATGRVVASAVTRLGGGAGYMVAARTVAVSPADGTILVAFEEAELPADGGAGAATKGETAATTGTPASTGVIVSGSGGTATARRASQRWSVALFSVATASLIRAPSTLTYRFSPFTPAAGVEPVTAAYSPTTSAYYVVCRNVALSNTRLPLSSYSLNSGVSYTLATLPAAASAGGNVGIGGGEELATRLLTVSFPDPATRAGAAELSPLATVFLDVSSSATTLQLALAVSSSVTAATLTTIRYDYGLTAASRATLSAGSRPEVAAVFHGAAAPSARLPTFVYGAVHAASAAPPASVVRAGRSNPPSAAADAPPPSCDEVRASAAGAANATAVLWPPLGVADASGAGAPAARWALSFGTRNCAEVVAAGVPSAGGATVYLVGMSGGSLDGAPLSVGEDGDVITQAARGAMRAWAVAIDAVTGSLPRLTPACGVVCVEPTPTPAPSVVPRPARTAVAAVPLPAGGGKEEVGASGNVSAEATVGDGSSDVDSGVGGDDDGGGVLWGLSLPVLAAIGAASLVVVCLFVAAVVYFVRATR